MGASLSSPERTCILIRSVLTKGLISETETIELPWKSIGAIGASYKGTTKVTWAKTRDGSEARDQWVKKPDHKTPCTPAASLREEARDEGTHGMNSSFRH